MNMSEKELQRILSQPDYGIVGTVDKPASDVRHEPHVNAPESPLERQFSDLWQLLGGPELVREYRFEPMRRWRADFAHIASRTLIEIEGGLYQQGRHQRLHGYQADCEKYNWATMTGWRVIRLTSAMLTPDYIESIIKWIQQEC